MKTNFQTRGRFQGLLALSLLASVGMANAAIVQYTTSGAFNTAVASGTIELNDFTGNGGPTGNFYGSPLGFNGGTFDFSLSVSPGGLHATTSVSDPGEPFTESFTTQANGVNLVVTFTSGNVLAVGGDFWLALNSQALVDGTFSVTVSDGAGGEADSTIPLTTTGSALFAGFTTDGQAFTTLTFNNGTSDYATLDNLFIGTAVPEAPTWIAASLLGLVAGVRLLRKRQCHSR